MCSNRSRIDPIRVVEQFVGSYSIVIGCALQKAGGVGIALHVCIGGVYGDETGVCKSRPLNGEPGLVRRVIVPTEIDPRGTCRRGCEV